MTVLALISAMVAGSIQPSQPDLQTPVTRWTPIGESGPHVDGGAVPRIIEL